VQPLPPPLPGQAWTLQPRRPQAFLEAAFKAAGFVNVASRVIDAPLRLSSAAECVRFEQESFGALHQMLASLDEQGKSAALGKKSRKKAGAVSNAMADSKVRASWSWAVGTRE